VQSTRLPLYNYGNELEQFYRYFHIVELVGESSLKLSQEVMAKYDASIMAFYYGDFEGYYAHRERLYMEEHPKNATYTAETFPSLWNRTIITIERGKTVKYAQDCDDEVMIDEFTINYVEEDNNFYTVSSLHDQAKQLST
jgi:hypothetical protein